MSWEAVLAFDTDNEDFVRGFEAGRIWVLMEENPDKLPGLIFHSVNAEMVMRMLEAKGLKLRAKFTDDETWMTFEEVEEDGATGVGEGAS
jgi:hypothetical protein